MDPFLVNILKAHMEIFLQKNEKMIYETLIASSFSNKTKLLLQM